AHPADGLAAHYLGADGVNAVWLDVLDIRKMNAVFIAERQIRQQISQRVEAALGQQFGALWADALDHAHFGGEGKRRHSSRGGSGVHCCFFYTIAGTLGRPGGMGWHSRGAPLPGLRGDFGSAWGVLRQSAGLACWVGVSIE